MAGTYIIKPEDSIFITGTHAFSDFGPGSITLAQDAYVSSSSVFFAGNAFNLTEGPWTLKIDGTAYSSALNGVLLATPDPAFTSKVTVGADGSIHGRDSGISSSHNLTVSNAGLIHGNNIAAIDVTTHSNATITNTKSGVMLSNAGDGIHFAGDGTHTITNAGFIAGGGGVGDFAIESAASNGVDKVTNSGTIAGQVSLGGGADTLTNSGSGVVTGVISMGAGDDKLTGGTSVEIVWDEAGNDKYALGGGNDVFLAFGANAEIGTDTIDGGAGIDTYSLVGSNAGVAVNLDTIAFGSAAAKTAIGAEIGVDKLTNIENVFGGGGADTIIGSGAANGLWGDGGGDFLHGRGGNDSIDGGAGSDSIAGGAGRDVLTGGSQDDTFYFTALADSGRTAATRDVITDFEGAGIIGGDKISLAAIDAIAGGADDTFNLLTSPFSEFTGAAGELRYLWTGLETVIQGDVNGDAKADFSIALTGQHILGVDDFNL